MSCCDKCKIDGTKVSLESCKCKDKKYCNGCANWCDGCTDAVCPKCACPIPPGSDWHYACKDCTEADV